MLAGELPSAIGAYDNAAEFPASVPTFAHRLRAAGYRTSLVGKMHFIGPDQLHGFEERPTTDVYPADLEMVPDWRLGRRRATRRGTTTRARSAAPRSPPRRSSATTTTPSPSTPAAR